MKFTQGKWIHGEDGVITVNEKQIVCVFPTDRMANTNLICAAPEMYAALKTFADIYNTAGSWMELSHKFNESDLATKIDIALMKAECGI
jgi:hypothetical protein